MELANLKTMGMEAVDVEQQKMFWPILEAMKRGVKIDTKRRAAFAEELMMEMEKREEFFIDILGHAFNPRSPTQMAKLFYEDLNQPVIHRRGKKGIPGGVTCDESALVKIAEREPILRPFIRRLTEYRSLGVFLSTFVMAPLDVDGRMRTSYNICGTETFRLSSSKNAFESGANLQNIPKGGEEDDSDLVLPNVRKIFVPDTGWTIFDTDLSKADLRIVVWESGEMEMKAMLAEGRDPYVETAREFYHDPTINKLNSDGTENHKYKTFKSFSHGSHYLGTPKGLAQRLGISVKESEATQKWYFGKYPKIPQWQKRIIEKVTKQHYVENAFGYRRYYFDRIDEAVFRQAIAWIAQSSV
ncbi:MAG: DNA polymerase, partial [Candidatus Dormibacteria bacterium]